MSFGKNKSSSSSKPLTAAELDSYYQQINANSGGRLDDWARQGTAETQYQALTGDQLRSLGGAGETRRAALLQSRRQAMEELDADPTLTAAGRVRARQLTDRGYTEKLDGVNQETEALLTQLAQAQADRGYQASFNNAKLTAEDLDRLAEIYFGGKGSVSTGKGSGFNIGFGKGE